MLCRQPCKNGWTYRDAVWVIDLGGLKEASIRWQSRCPHAKEQCWGKDMPNDTLLWGVQRWLNWSRCHLSCGLGWAKGSMCYMGAHWRHLANVNASYLLIYANEYHRHNRLWPFFQDHPGEPVPEENFWTLWCKWRLTEADTPTIRLGATPSGLSSAHLHHPPIFYRPDALPAAQPTVSKHWTHTRQMHTRTILVVALQSNLH